MLLKKISLLLLLLYVVHQTHAQKQHFEIHATALTSQLSGDSYRGYKKFGIEVGAGALFPLKTEGHFIGVGLNYIEKGARDRKDEERGDFNDYRLNMNYIEAPFTYHLPLWGVYIEGGLSFAYRIKFEQTNNNLPASAPPNLRRMELGLVAGVNLEITDNLIFSLRLLNSLTPVYNTTAPIVYWFQQGGMHSVIAARLQFYFSKPNFVWVKKTPQVKTDN